MVRHFQGGRGAFPWDFAIGCSQLGANLNQPTFVMGSTGANRCGHLELFVSMNWPELLDIIGNMDKAHWVKWKILGPQELEVQ